MRALWIIILCLAGCGAAPGASGVAGASGGDAADLSNISDPATLPRSGQARYAGTLSADLPVLPDGAYRRYQGDLRLTVDFAARRDAITGDVTALRAGQDRLTGKLEIFAGRIYRDADPRFDMTMTAMLRGSLTRKTTLLELDGEITGDFRGRSQDRIDGLVFGVMVGPRGEDIYDGSFAATRND